MSVMTIMMICGLKAGSNVYLLYESNSVASAYEKCESYRAPVENELRISLACQYVKTVCSREKQDGR